MVRTVEEKAKLVQRVRRIRHRIEAIERALEAEHRCAVVLRLIAAAKAALNGLMAEVLEGYIYPHLLDANHRRPSGQAQAERELKELIRSYLP
jgi:DNA-binding FrmR family transcriptional regulator